MRNLGILLLTLAACNGTDSIDHTGDGGGPDAGGEPTSMIEIPAGTFSMGCNEAVEEFCVDKELPYHEVYVSAFEIDRTEVTQGEYDRCITAGVCSAGAGVIHSGDDYPMAAITFRQAAGYCAWAGKRLPTEAEWEKAARGTDGRTFPWGEEEPNCGLTNMTGCSSPAEPRKVGVTPSGASPYGVLDMAGNLSEFVSDYYSETYYQESASSDPAGPSDGSLRSQRGGGFADPSSYTFRLETSSRSFARETDWFYDLGFRCARSL